MSLCSRCTPSPISANPNEYLRREPTRGERALNFVADIIANGSGARSCESSRYGRRWNHYVVSLIGYHDFFETDFFQISVGTFIISGTCVLQIKSANNKVT